MNSSNPYINEKLASLQELIGCVSPMYFTCYSGNTLEALYTTAPNIDFVSALLTMDGLTPLANITTAESNSDLQTMLIGHEPPILPRLEAPLICTNDIGMVWISDMEFRPGDETLIHVMGPVFPDEFSITQIENRLDHLHLSVSLKRHFLSMIRSLPVIPIQLLLQYAVMMHYCLSGEKITVDELHRSVPYNPAEENPSAPQPNRSVDYILEQQLLDCVREGNLAYRSIMDQLSNFNDSGKLADHDYLRHVKNLQITFTALCTRASIEGGLSPDTAYMLSDYYIQKIEAQTSLALLGSVGHSMLEDFTSRVHRLKNSRISPPVQRICDRIHLHPEVKTNIHLIAEEMGYSDYYLSKKFKQEMGCSINEYATAQKIEKAKQLLTGSQMTVGQIADSLNICSQSYFGNLFFKHVGMTPLEYRNRSGD